MSTDRQSKLIKFERLDNIQIEENLQELDEKELSAVNGGLWQPVYDPFDPWLPPTNPLPTPFPTPYPSPTFPKWPSPWGPVIL